MMKTIKIKKTGVVTTVSEEYFKTYENGGWFIEVMPVVKKAPKKVIVKEESKEA